MVITVLQEQKNKEKKTLLELLREKQIYIDAPCNGRGSCGKCLVQYRSGAPEPVPREREKLTEEKLREGWRLACLSVPKEECEVCISAQKQENMKVETGFFHGSPSGKERWSQENLKVKSGFFHGSPSGKERWSQENLKVETGKSQGGGFFAQKQPIHRKNEDGKRTGEDETENYGAALDIGTTTLAAALIKISTGETCGNAVSVNHQRAYGADVISRIKAANEGKAAALQNSIREDILALMGKLAEQAQIAGEQITTLVIAGNTTMCHLLLGYSCEGLGKAPFTPVDISLQKKSWKQVFGNEEYRAKITVLPGISAFVGADIVAGIYSTDLCRSNREKTGERGSGAEFPRKNGGEGCALLLDIGTNGEMALFAGDRLFVTSVAAGPAFEGGNISCGMAGIPGAISHAALFGKNRMVVKTIGNARPEGLCGSGIVDVVYELVKHRLVDENGTLQPEFFENGYPVVKDRVFFTQEDIRQVQMAKAAIHAGIELLLREAGMQLSQVEQVFLAGGFGTAIDVDKAAGIGLLPRELRRRVAPVGNSALEGAKRCILEPDTGEEMAALAKTAQEINLALRQEFEETYLEHMQFLEGR